MQSITQIASQILKLTRTGLAPDVLFDKFLSVLIKSVGANAAIIYSFHEEPPHFSYMSSKGVPEQKTENLSTVVSSMLDAHVRTQPANVLKKYNSVTLCFSSDDAKRLNAAALVAYFIFEQDTLSSAVVFVKNRGTTCSFRIDVLNSQSSLLLLLMTNKMYREKASSFAHAVNCDGLTGLYNHRYFQESLSGELLRSQRFDYPVSLLMIDVDHFKEYNDKHGHPKGDIVLKDIARILKESLRAYDIPARYGGEELVVILPYTTQEQAMPVAERIRKNVAHYGFPGEDGNEKVNVTISIGVSAFPLNAKTKSDLINRADQALYLAKSEGRNRVCLSLVISKELIRIGFCPPAFTSSYYNDILSGARDVIKEIPNIDLLIRAPERESDYGTLSKIFEEFVSEKVDAVALCTQTKAITREIALLNDAKIPVFMFNVPEKIEGVHIESYVGYNQVDAGKEVGKYLARILRYKGTVAVIEGLNQPTSIRRVQGFREELERHPAIKIVVREKADWLRARAKEVTEAILEKYPGIDALFAVNDEMALGAIEGVESKGKLGHIFVIGLDGTLDALNSIKGRKLTATLSTNPHEMGRILLRTMVRGLIKEEKIFEEISSPINIVDLENVAFHM
ncbi:MAG: diguanylate cyclase [Chitinispirillaceae bacterium]|nr:diguanylate cyclase [Chitinispirillaceae bacterium]